MKFSALTFTIVFLLSNQCIAAASGGESSGGGGGPSQPNVGEVYSDAVNSANKIGFDLVREIIKSDKASFKPWKNTLVSPISAFATFSLLHVGLKGKSLAELETVMGVRAIDHLTFDTQSAALLNALRIDPAPVESASHSGPNFPSLGISNSAWSTNGNTSGERFEFNSIFSDILKKNYGATVKSLDFLAPSTLDTINQWGLTETHGLVPQILDAETLAKQAWLLMNATFIEANWPKKFGTLNAKLAPKFSLMDGKQISVEMITGSGIWDYTENEKYQAVAIPFFGTDLAFYVVQPNSPMVFSNLVMSFTHQDFWSSLHKELSTTKEKNHEDPVEVDLKMPAFTFDYSVKMEKENSLLSKLGIEKLFSQDRGPDFLPIGNFSGSTPREPIGLTLIKQDSKITLDQNGVKAAAITVIGGGGGGDIRMPTSKEITIDKPFIFAIASSKNGAIIFLGTVVNPNQ